MLGGATVVLDMAKNEVRITAPRWSRFAGRVNIKPGMVITTLEPDRCHRADRPTVGQPGHPTVGHGYGQQRLQGRYRVPA